MRYHIAVIQCYLYSRTAVLNWEQVKPHKRVHETYFIQGQTGPGDLKMLLEVSFVISSVHGINKAHLELRSLLPCNVWSV